MPITISPTYPSRPPFVIRNPSPPVVIRMNPASVMERSPAPVVIRNPSITILSHDPMAIGPIRHKIWSDVRKPDVSIFIIIHPLTIGSQFVVEQLERNSAPSHCFSRLNRNHGKDTAEYGDKCQFDIV